MTTAPHLLGYARVSTDSQRSDLQIDALGQAGAERIFTDQMTGTRLDRPGLGDLLDYARPGDIVLVYSISRVSRSVPDLLRLVETLRERGVGIRSLTEPIDTTSASPTAEFTLVLLGALAAMERGILSERTRAGVEAARARGRVPGRRPVDPDLVSAARDLVAAGRSVAEAARAVGLGRSTLYRELSREATPAA